jgi:hypothetical protein
MLFIYLLYESLGKNINIIYLFMLCQTVFAIVCYSAVVFLELHRDDIIIAL